MQLPAAEKASARLLCRHGCPSATAAAIGFTPKEMLSGGYSTAAAVRACSSLPALAKSGLPAAALVKHDAEVYVGTLRGAAGARRLLAAGFSVQEVWGSGLCNAADLHAAGVTELALEHAEVGDRDLCTGGYKGRTAIPAALMAKSLPAVTRVRREELGSMPAFAGSWSSSLMQSLHGNEMK